MSREQGRFLTELRRSNAAGIHSSQPSRSQSRRIAIAEGLDMPAFSGDNGFEAETGMLLNDGRKMMSPKSSVLDEEASLDDLDGPTEEELALIEAELEADGFWRSEDDRYFDFDVDDYRADDE